MYVTDPDSKLYISENRIVCEGNDIKTMLPLETLEGIVLVGNAGITSHCSKEMLERGIPVSYISGRGEYFGRLQSTRHVNIQRQRCQFRCGDNDSFCMEITRGIISAKIHNQCVLLRRYNRRIADRKVEENISEMKRQENLLQTCTGREQIMGYEGIASRLYFESLSRLVDEEFSFKGRSKMPPKDPFNSLLSFGYTLLLYEVFNAIELKGLNPYAGFMHQDRQGHPALASDLMEEWRPVIVDSLVMSMLNNGKFSKYEFIENEENKGILLEKNAVKRFVRSFEEKVRSEAGYLAYVNYSLSFRKSIMYQAGIIARAVEENDAALYKPVRLR